MQDAISLYQFNQYVKQVISVNFDEPMWIRCEVASMRHNRGHVYLELVENSPVTGQVMAQMSAVIWAGDYLRISGKLEGQTEQLLKQGAEVQLLVDLNFHERYGIKLNIRDIDIYFALGQLEMQRREVLVRLQKEELLDRNKMLTLPLVLQRIAVISSVTAAGFSDFMAHLEKNTYRYQIACTHFQSSMQGEQVSIDVAKHLAQINQDSFDVVVIIRGGGSRLDLTDFDSFAIGHAIAKCPIPVLTGIGHEIDVSIADLCAHLSCKTPTAVADFIISRMRDFDQKLSKWAGELVRVTQLTVQQSDRKLSRWASDIQLLANGHAMREQERIQLFQYRITSGAFRMLDIAAERLRSFEEKLDVLDFHKTLERGFTLSLTMEGKRICNIEQLLEGQLMVTRFARGSVLSRIEKTNQNGQKKRGT